jgi:hypothetical protein
MLSGTLLRLAIYDGRPDTAQFSGISDALVGAFTAAYPSARIRRVPPDSIYADSPSGSVTVRIALAAYVADFGRKISPAIGTIGGTFVVGVIPEGMWNGLAATVVTFIDTRRPTPVVKSQSIGKLVSKSNTFGYKTAHDALDESFRQTISELLLFVDASAAR